MFAWLKRWLDRVVPYEPEPEPTRLDRILGVGMEPRLTEPESKNEEATKYE